jgi:Rrf2 family protein
MKFSSQEEYGIRCLMEIARGGPTDSVTISEISRSEGLTEPYVAKLLMILRKGGLINSTRGHSGGYTLARPAAEIKVGEVLGVLGGKLIEDDFCDRHGGVQEICSHAEGCNIKSLWGKVQAAVDAVLDGITLADIIRDENAELIQLQTTVPQRFRTTTEVQA